MSNSYNKPPKSKQVDEPAIYKGNDNTSNRLGTVKNSDKENVVISLFCGAGGLDLGFEQAGFRSLLAIDSNTAAVGSYNKNARYPVAVHKDISRTSPVDLVNAFSEVPSTALRGIIGGPPCQGFSNGNVKANPKDPRNRLPFTYARLIGQINRETSVDFFVFENVTGLRRPKHASRWSRIKTEFRRAGFNLFEDEIDALHFGLPQVRRRVFLIGINKQLHPDAQFEFPTGDSMNLKTLEDTIKGLPEPMFFNRGFKSSEMPFHPNHWTMNPRSSRFETGRFNQSRSFRKLSWNQPSPTVAYGHREIHVHPDGQRRLSILEAMIIQGFPRNYVLCGTLSEQVTQVSNAVPPPVAQALALAIRNSIRSPDRRGEGASHKKRISGLSIKRRLTV